MDYPTDTLTHPAGCWNCRSWLRQKAEVLYLRDIAKIDPYSFGGVPAGRCKIHTHRYYPEKHEGNVMRANDHRDDQVALLATSSKQKCELWQRKTTFLFRAINE